MIKVQYRCLMFVVILFSIISVGIAQDNIPYKLTYEVNRSNPNLTVTRSQLNEASSLLDLNEHFKSKSDREYISVEIMTSYNGTVVKSVSIDDKLNQEQKEAMEISDVGRNIKVVYRYVPNSGSNNNDVKTDDFSFSILPEYEAQYPKGTAMMNTYIEETVFSKISHKDIDIYNLAAIKFTIDEEGHIVNPHVVASSKDKLLDALLLETICNMPSWTPAQYANGKKIQQDFVLTVGDHSSCTINTLDINRFNFKE